MAVLELLDKKIAELQANNTLDIEKMNKVLNCINSALEALNDEKILIDYDFNIAISLVRNDARSFGLIDYEKAINDIKNVLLAKQKFQLPDLQFSEEQNRAIKLFKERLEAIAKELVGLIETEKNKKVNNELLENLEDLKKLLEGKGRRKYYTYEMLEALFEVVDYKNLSYNDLVELSNSLAVSKNSKEIDDNIDEKKQAVIDLLREYLGNRLRIDLIEKYQTEICAKIDLDNARKILDLFKKEKIIKKFNSVTLLIILLRGRYEFIKDFYYENVLPCSSEFKDTYFEQVMSCVWINEKKAGRKYSNAVRNPSQKGNGSSILTGISEASNDDFIENIRLLKENESIFKDKYDLSNLKDLWVLTRPSCLIKKNIELFKLYNINDVSLSAIAQCDLGNKFDLIIELGLLNPPRNNTYRNFERAVPRYSDFISGIKRKLYSGSILNYYQRNTGQIATTSRAEYITWFHKMQKCGKEEFYANFFSSKHIGMRSMEDRSKEGLNNHEKIDNFVKEHFVDNDYPLYIDKYVTYYSVINDFYNSPQGDVILPYYDSNIVNDEITKKIERFNTVDEYYSDGEMKEVSNPYSYMFDETIISRYKVLRNLTILKRQFGYLNDDMLLTAIVYHSYLSKDTFEMIKESIEKGMAK